MTAAADRRLLFGLLALQNGLIDQGALVAAFQAWTRDKSKSLADHLEARGDLTGPESAPPSRHSRGPRRNPWRRRREEPGRSPRQPIDPCEAGGPFAVSAFSRAGSLQGLLPGAPTDPGVHVKRGIPRPKK